MSKKVVSSHQPRPPHMVGDGLPVRNLFSYNDLGKSQLSPFLMLDYGSPSEFPPTEKKLGVGMHPHRGFETVTLVLQGGLQHKDTAGNFGEIGPGDVQWMTAGKGVLHEELHSESFRKTGGTLQMVQLWVNLPADKKMTEPRYQTLHAADIPVIVGADGASKTRVISGKLGDVSGPAKTFTPVNLIDIEFTGKGRLSVVLPEGYTTALFVMEGAVTVNGTDTTDGISIMILERNGSKIEMAADGPARLLILNGKQIDEPVVGYGPFVMNSSEEIQQAMQDFSSGTFSTAQ
ncbi:MAG: pirin family protein [Candidatus Melainabacteria bacterium]|nr:pirin family protein [Candidatus Melainabacteria bacterium]